MKKTFKPFLLLIVIGMFFIPVNSFAAPLERIIGYTGFLELGGSPISGTYRFVFKIWNLETGGTAGTNMVWEEVYDLGGVDNRLNVVDGEFSVWLGSLTPLPEEILRDDSQYWLEITYNDGIADLVMSPRKKISFTPYSMTTSGYVDANAGLVIENRTSDPASPQTGQIWLRTDL